MPVLATALNVDVAILSSVLGIITTLFAGAAWAAKALNAIDNRFLALESKNELSMHKTKSALRFLKYDLDSVKGYLLRSTDFQDRHIKPNTGADFLNEN